MRFVIVSGVDTLYTACFESFDTTAKMAARSVTIESTDWHGKYPLVHHITLCLTNLMSPSNQKSDHPGIFTDNILANVPPLTCNTNSELYSQPVALNYTANMLQVPLSLNSN